MKLDESLIHGYNMLNYTVRSLIEYAELMIIRQELFWLGFLNKLIYYMNLTLKTSIMKFFQHISTHNIQLIIKDLHISHEI